MVAAHRLLVLVLMLGLAGLVLADGLPTGLPMWTLQLTVDSGVWSTEAHGPAGVFHEEWDFDARLSDRCIVWQHDDGHDWEIYAGSPGEGCRQITGNEFEDVCPDVDGDIAAWWGHDGEDWDVYVWGPWGEIVRLGTRRGTDEYPRVSRGRVAWYGWDGSDYEVFVWDSRTNQTTQLTDNTVDDGAVAIDGDELVWMSWDGTDYEIMYLDLATGERRQLTDNDVNDRLPDVSDGLIAWESGDGGQAEVWVRQGSARPRRLTFNNCADWFVDVCKGRVLWEQHAGSSEIMVWDSTGDRPVMFALTDNASPELNPRSNGKWVVWSQQDLGEAQVGRRDPRGLRPRPAAGGAVPGDYDVFMLQNLEPFCRVAQLVQTVDEACEWHLLQEPLATALTHTTQAALRALRSPEEDAQATCGKHLGSVIGMARQECRRTNSEEGLAGRLLALAQQAYASVGDQP